MLAQAKRQLEGADRGREFLDAIRAGTHCPACGWEAGGASAWPAPVDLEALAEREPQKPKFIVPDWLPANYASLLAGHGGVGKSGLALHLAMCIASGEPFFGIAVTRRRVLYLSCEDRQDLLHWRLSRIEAHTGIRYGSLRGWLEIVDLVGHDSVLWERDARGAMAAPAFTHLAERFRASESQVLFVDGASDTFAGNENARADVKRFVNSLVSLIPADGAVLLIAHVAKPTAASAATSEGYSGSTAWHNSVRARWYLYPETAQGDDSARPERTGELLLELQKSNLGRVDQAMRFRWDEQAHLFVGEQVGATNFDRKHRDREEQAGIRAAMKACIGSGEYVPAAMTGPRTAIRALAPYQLPPTMSGKDGTRRFWRHLEELRAMKQIREEGIARKSDRHTVRCLVLTEEGMRACGQ